MPETDRERFALRGVVLEAVREYTDRLVRDPHERRPIGKVPACARASAGPSIPYLGGEQIGHDHPNLVDVGDSVALRLVQQRSAPA